MSLYAGLSCVRGAESCIFMMAYGSIYCLFSIRVQSAGRDNFRYPVRWWSVQNTLPTGPHTLSCIFLSAAFILLVYSAHSFSRFSSLSLLPRWTLYVWYDYVPSFSKFKHLFMVQRGGRESAACQLPEMMRRIRQSADVILVHFDNCTFYAWKGYVLLFYPESPCVVLKNILPLFHTLPVWVRECEVSY